MQPISSIVFIKKESERLPGKNFRLFNGRPLYTIILQLLNKHPLISEILVDSDSDEILSYTLSLKKGVPITRPQKLYGGNIGANDLIAHDISFSSHQHFLQTHCTNPLLTSKTISSAIDKYFNNLNSNDSMFSVSRIQQRVFWSNSEPVNHSKEKLVRTQDLQPLFVENAAFFIFSKSSFKNSGNNRIGLKPYMFETATTESVDIDYEKDFKLAELIDKNKNYFPETFTSSL